MKEFLCIQCKGKTITERENTLHTAYSHGLCEKCSPKPKEKIPGPQEDQPQIEKANPLECKVCGKLCKTKGGLKVHKKIHKQK